VYVNEGIGGSRTPSEHFCLYIHIAIGIFLHVLKKGLNGEGLRIQRGGGGKICTISTIKRSTKYPNNKKI
jgi:hypothetical protein